MNEVVIRADKIKKSYRQYKSNWQKIQFLLMMRDAGKKERILKGVSFEIHKGEKVGIIGRPTSGRSTLMRILAGIIRPDSGTVEVNGELTAVMDNKMGFQNVMTGRDNYRARCKIIGWSDKDIKEREQAVFEFAGLSKEIDQPLKMYRKGRANRLGFTIATEFKPEIMLYDEIFAFGTKRFNSKAISHLRKLIGDDETTFVMTVNDREAAAELCDRGIVIHGGKVVFDGPFAEAVEYFDTNCKKKSAENADDDEQAEGERERRRGGSEGDGSQYEDTGGDSDSDDEAF